MGITPRVQVGMTFHTNDMEAPALDAGERQPVGVGRASPLVSFAQPLNSISPRLDAAL